MAFKLKGGNNPIKNNHPGVFKQLAVGEAEGTGETWLGTDGGKKYKPEYTTTYSNNDQDYNEGVYQTPGAKAIGGNVVVYSSDMVGEGNRVRYPGKEGHPSIDGGYATSAVDLVDQGGDKLSEKVDRTFDEFNTNPTAVGYKGGVNDVDFGERKATYKSDDPESDVELMRSIELAESNAPTEVGGINSVLGGLELYGRDAQSQAETSEFQQGQEKLKVKKAVNDVTALQEESNRVSPSDNRTKWVIGEDERRAKENAAAAAQERELNEQERYKMGSTPNKKTSGFKMSRKGNYGKEY